MAPPHYSSRRNPWCLGLLSDSHGGERLGSSSGSMVGRATAMTKASSGRNGGSGGGGSSVQRASALEIVAAFNRNNIETQTIASFVRADCFVREILPASLKQTPHGADGFRQTLNMYRAVFRHYALEVLEVVDDVPARKVCLWLTARADTVAGEYVCDMVWALTFDEGGRKVVRWKEFLDAGGRTMEFLPETMGAGSSS